MSSAKKFLVFFFCVLLIFSLFVGVVLEVSAVPILWEYHNVDDDAAFQINGDTWCAQTFTVGGSAHTVTSVKLKLYRFGNPNTVYVSIKAVDGSSHPSGADLTSGTTNGNTLTTDTAGEWREVALGEYSLSAGVKYAIVVHIVGNASNFLKWREDYTSPTYSGGCEEYTVNAGSSWTTRTDRDQMFEVYGNPLIANYNFSLSGSCVITSSLSSSKVIEKGLSNAATCSDEYLTVQKNLYRSTTATTTITTLLSTSKSIIVTVVENFFESLTASATLETLKHLAATILDFSGIVTVNGVLDIPGLVAAGDNALLFAVLAFIIALAAIAVAIFWRSTDRSQQV